MIEQQLKSFIDVTVSYFDKVTNEGASVSDPIIHFQEQDRLDYTGIIEISGLADGYAYITADRAMLSDLVRTLGEKDTNEETLADMIGEIANTIVSNVRRDFGPSFRVSVPQIALRKDPFPLALPAAFFEVPITWRGHHCFLVIAFTEASATAA